MRPTSSLSFRPTLLALEDRAVPATLIELTTLTRPSAPPAPADVADVQQTDWAPPAVQKGPVARPATRRF